MFTGTILYRAASRTADDDGYATCLPLLSSVLFSLASVVALPSLLRPISGALFFFSLHVLAEKVVQSKKAFLGAAIRRTKELMWYIKQEEGRGGIPFSQQSRSFLHPGIHDSSLLPQSSAQLLVEVIPFRGLFVHNLVVEEFLFFRKFTGIFHFELGDFICP